MTRPAWRRLAAVAALGLGLEGCGSGGRASAAGAPVPEAPAAEIETASRGIALRLGGSVYPKVLDVTGTFGEAHADAAAYVTARMPLEPTLALRVAGKKVWGTYPLHETATVGGWSTVRGFPEHRFAGDAALSGNVELRLSVARCFFLLPGELGVFGLGDAGRVYLSGETSDRWHTAGGDGLWVAFLSRANTVSVAAADGGERMRLYVRAGFAF